MQCVGGWLKGRGLGERASSESPTKTPPFELTNLSDGVSSGSLRLAISCRGVSGLC